MKKPLKRAGADSPLRNEEDALVANFWGSDKEGPEECGFVSQSERRVVHQKKLVVPKAKAEESKPPPIKRKKGSKTARGAGKGSKVEAEEEVIEDEEEREEREKRQQIDDEEEDQDGYHDEFKLEVAVEKGRKSRVNRVSAKVAKESLKEELETSKKSRKKGGSTRPKSSRARTKTSKADVDAARKEMETIKPTAMVDPGVVPTGSLEIELERVESAPAVVVSADATASALPAISASSSMTAPDAEVIESFDVKHSSVEVHLSAHVSEVGKVDDESKRAKVAPPLVEVVEVFPVSSFNESVVVVGVERAIQNVDSVVVSIESQNVDDAAADLGGFQPMFDADSVFLRGVIAESFLPDVVEEAKSVDEKIDPDVFEELKMVKREKWFLCM